MLEKSETVVPVHVSVRAEKSPAVENQAQTRPSLAWSKARKARRAVGWSASLNIGFRLPRPGPATGPTFFRPMLGIFGLSCTWPGIEMVPLKKKV
jgi:hypothetical protein